VIVAARIGARFGLDPVAVLGESDWRRHMIREAAWLIAERDEAHRWSVDG
jgi:hypothetical protein